VLVLVASACTPVGSFQTARPLPPGKTSITLAMSRVVEVTDDANDQWEELDLLVRVGVAHAWEVGGRWTLVLAGDEPIHAFLVDGKWAVVPGRLAFILPVGFNLTDGDVDIWQAHPGAIVTVPLGESAELDLAGKTVVAVGEDGSWEMLVGAAVGVRVGRDLAEFSIHPEVAVIWDPDERFAFVAFGVAGTASP
jgi:hypothetical protein